MPTIEFELPGEPGSKGRPRFVRATGRTYTPEKTVAYGARVSEAATTAMNGAIPALGPVRVYLSCYFAIPKSANKAKRAAAEAETAPVLKKPDVDNLVKGVLDAMNGIVFHDDSQAYIVHTMKVYSPRPRIEVQVVIE